MTDPLALTLVPTAPRLPAGAAVLLELRVTLRASGPLETVELNGGRTRVEVVTERPAAEGGPSRRELSGADHAALHRPRPDVPLGDTIDLPAGTSSFRLALADYAPTLPVGRHRVTVRYRLGDGPGAFEAVSNTVVLEVVPATPTAVVRGWLRDGRLRGTSAFTWRLDPPGAWLLRLTQGFDAEAVLGAFALPAPAGAAPGLALLNDYGDMHWEKRVVWLEGGVLQVLPVERRDVIGPPTGHEVPGLAAGAALVDPPLQRRDGGVRALVDQGGRLLVADVGPDGVAAAHAVEAPGAALHRGVVWSAGEDDPRAGALVRLAREGRALRLWRHDLAGGPGALLWEEPREAAGWALVQAAGVGYALVVVRDDPAADDHEARPVLRAVAAPFDLEEPPPEGGDGDEGGPPATVAAGAWALEPGERLLDVAGVAERPAAVLLLDGPEGHRVVGPGLGKRLPSTGPAWLMVSSTDVFVLRPDEARGIASAHVGALAGGAPPAGADPDEPQEEPAPGEPPAPEEDE